MNGAGQAHLFQPRLQRLSTPVETDGEVVQRDAKVCGDGLAVNLCVYEAPLDFARVVLVDGAAGVAEPLVVVQAKLQLVEELALLGAQSVEHREATADLLAALALYVFTGLFWLPVVWIQHKLRDLAREAAETGAPLPERYFRLYRIWFACGFPAFFAVLAILWLMVSRPVF